MAITRIPPKRAKRRFSNAIKKPGATPVEFLSAAQPDAIGAPNSVMARRRSDRSVSVIKV